MIEDLKKVLKALKLVLPYLDRDGDGNTLYCADGPPAYREFQDFKDDIALLEDVIRRMERIAPLVPE